MCVAMAGGQPAVADLVLVNGRIFTVDPALPRVEAVAIRGDRIVARGTDAAVRTLAGPSTRVVDAGGRVVIPGINDAHAHVGARPPGQVLRLAGDDPPLDEVIARVRETAAAAPEGAWIFGTFGERALSDPKATRFTLDEVAPRHRVKLAAWTGHGNLLNTAALRALGIGEKEPDPPFGRYPRRNDGVITGQLEEYADVRANRRMTGLAGRDGVVASLRELAGEAVSYGVTGIQAMANSVPARDLAEALALADTPIRWRVIRFPIALDAKDDPASLGPILPPASPLIRVSGVKWVLDGTPVERLAALKEPYADRGGWSGRLNLTPAQIEVILRRSLTAGEQVLFHATGDRTAAVVLDAMKQVAPASRWVTARLRLEHGDLLEPAAFDTAREMGVIVVQNPAHFTIGPLLAARLGPQRARSAQSIKALLAADVKFALGSDGPLNPFLNMMFAVTHPANPGQALTREQVVAAYTIGSAYAEFQERDRGSIVEGKLADLAVLSQDIFSIDPGRLPATRAVVTIVNGRVVRDERKN
jgi:predicted amidohydrolase YtcJ